MFPRAVWFLFLTCLGCQAILATSITEVAGDSREAARQPDVQPPTKHEEHDARKGERERQRLRDFHKKRLEFAEAADDEYEVHLQRGIGLLLLAEERALLGDPAGDVPVEGLLFNAAACLTRAHALRREQARPCWYLHEVWRQLGQPQQARRWLKNAEAAAPFSALTADEQRGLLMAARTENR